MSFTNRVSAYLSVFTATFWLLMAVPPLWVFFLLSTATAQLHHSSAYRCCTGRTVRFALGPVDYPPYYYYNSATGVYSGFIPEMIHLLAAEMDVDYVIIPTTNAPTGIALSVDPTTGMMGRIDRSSPLAQGLVDADLVLTSNDLYTINLTDVKVDDAFVITDDVVSTETTGLVYKEQLRGDNAFALFEPFTPTVWFALGMSLIAYTVLLVLLAEMDARGDGSGAYADDDSAKPTKPTGARGLRMAAQRSVTSSVRTGYHVIAACFGGDDYEWADGSRRLLRLSLLGLILVTGTTYTANLAAFFNKASISVHGPQSEEELLDAIACVPYAEKGQQLTPYVASSIYMGDGVRDPTDPTWDTRSAAYCLEALRSGEADVWMTDRETLHSQHLNACNETREATFIRVLPFSMAWALRAEDAHIALGLSVAWRFLQSQKQGVNLRNEYYFQGRTCPTDESGATDPVGLKAMSGLFLLCGGVAVAALLMGLAARLMARGCPGRGVVRPSGSSAAGSSRTLDHTATEGELLRLLLAKVERLQEQQQQPEARRDSERSAAKTEPAPMPKPASAKAA